MIVLFFMFVAWIKGWYYSQTNNIKYTNSNFSATCKERRVVTSTKNNVNTIQSTGAHLKWNKLILHQETGGCNRPINNMNIIHLSTQSSNKTNHSWNFKKSFGRYYLSSLQTWKNQTIIKEILWIQKSIKNFSVQYEKWKSRRFPGDFQAKKNPGDENKNPGDFQEVATLSLTRWACAQRKHT